MKSRLHIVALALVTLLAACSGSTDTTDGQESMLRYFPEETSGVVFVDLGALRDHTFVGKFIEDRAGVQSPDELDRLEAATGFDFENDVRQIMAGSMGGGRGLVVVNADFDLPRVVAYLRGEGMAYGEHNGTELFRPEAASGDTGENPGTSEAPMGGVVAFLDDVVLIGSEPEVRGAIDRSEGNGTTALDNARLVADILEIEDGYQVWATGRIDTRLLPQGVAGGPMELLGALERGTYQMRIDDAITARAVGQFTSEEQARTVTSLLEGLRGMALLQEMTTEFRDVLSGILIANEGSRVELQLQVDTALLDELAESGQLSR